MTRNEAIIFLLKCHPLIDKLIITDGFEKELDSEDQEAFRGFCKVWASGWLGDLGVQEAARLSPIELDLLIAKLIQQVLNYK